LENKYDDDDDQASGRQLTPVSRVSNDCRLEA